jgi:hypothetical protein
MARPLNRRRFLATFGIGAAGLAVGCGGPARTPVGPSVIAGLEDEAAHLDAAADRHLDPDCYANEHADPDSDTATRGPRDAPIHGRDGVGDARHHS